MSKAGVFVASQSFLHTIHNWRWSSQVSVWPAPVTGGHLVTWNLFLTNLDPGWLHCCQPSVDRCSGAGDSSTMCPVVSGLAGARGHRGHRGQGGAWSHWSSGTRGVVRPCQVMIGWSFQWHSSESPSTSLMLCKAVHWGHHKISLFEEVSVPSHLSIIWWSKIMYCPFLLVLWRILSNEILVVSRFICFCVVGAQAVGSLSKWRAE